MHCYKQNIKVSGLLVLEKYIISYCFLSIVRTWKLKTPILGLDWQDLCKATHNIVVY